MTSVEFRDWATSAAADWGYRVEIGGVGVSSSPSYYPADHPTPHAPIYASQVALFRLGSGIPARSPRSVRSTELPWLSKEDNHPHKLVGRFTHPVTATPSAGAGEKGPRGAQEVQQRVRDVMGAWKVPEVTLGELWGGGEVAASCGGSRRYLVACLGGWGDQPALEGVQAGEWTVRKDERGVVVRWNGYKGEAEGESGSGKREKEWGELQERTQPSQATGGW